jgi:signal transduction histidine kinase
MTQQENQTAPEELAQKLRAVAEYERKMDEIAELVARVRHEINNPLTGVLGQAQLLLREDLSEKARKRVQTIEDLSIRMRDIVAQLRQVQRSVRGTEENEPVAADQSAEAAGDL